MLDSTPFAIHIAPKQTTTVNLPDYLESGRIWLAEGDLHFKVNQDGSFAEPSGSDPSLPEYNLKWGFVELTHTKDATFVNLSFVDWVGLSIGMSLTSEKGTEEVKGLEGGALKKICEEMKQQSSAKDAGGRPEWGQMCVNAADGALVRIYSSLDRARNSMADFYTSDIDAMWTRYGKEDLVIHMQSEENGLALPTAGQGVSATCRVQGANMTCDRTAGAYSYGKPTTADIWGCDSGPFVVGPVDTAIPITMFHSRIIPRLCAMFTRGTHALTDGNTQPYTDITQYYKHPVCNHYSRIVHNHLDNLKGYAFAYDDVNPDGIDHNAAGVLFASFPEKFHIDVKRD
ncbi:hypothetical protein TruAng_002829 [Truncatella angustata]|nr:hypothetical protein TruAng_002829 [Truncatella angustata]